MMGDNRLTTLTFYSVRNYTKDIYRTRRPRNQIHRRTLGLKTQKSVLCLAMANLASHVPTSFSMRNAFTLFILQLLTISNYLHISRQQPNIIAEAIEIQSIDFPSHVLIGHPVSFNYIH